MSGNIGFQVYPTSNRVPGVFAEVNNTQANSATVNQNSLLIGSMLATGTAVADTPIQVSGTNYNTLFGAGSILSLMIAQYLKSDNFGTLWALPLADATGSTAASATMTIAGIATASGVIALYIAGTLVSTAVSAGDTATVIAGNINAAIVGTPGLPVSSEVAGGVITITALNKGLTGNDIDLRLNYQGNAGGQSTPAGITITFTGTASGSGYLLAGGATNPTLSAALANLPAQNFDFIGSAYTDSASLDALDLFLSDETGRWSWTSELFGGYFAAYRGTLGALSTFGVGNNNQHGSIMGIFDVPQPAWVWAAEIAAQCAVSIRANPATPLQNIIMNVMAPPLASQFDISERNTLLYDGLSTFHTSTAGQVIMERMCTTYQTNAEGQPDNSYLDVETMYTLMAGIRDMRTFLTSQYPRSILVANGTAITGGSTMVTAASILASVNARYNTQCAAGYMQDAAGFAKQSQAQNAGSGLVKLLLPFRLANQLRQIAMLIAFTKP
jgi:phage tail sheath gpL-like